MQSVLRGLRILASCVRNHFRTLRAVVRTMCDVHREWVWTKSPISAVPLEETLDPGTEVVLSDFAGRAGNVSLYELAAIGAIVRARQPRVLLEIGTFDGRTTLQMARNSPDDATIYTLDLPPDGEAALSVERRDLPHISDRAKLDRKYTRAPEGERVVQCLGDSATFDFRARLEAGPPELVFIDGSHSYDYVKNDTEKVLEILAPGGFLLWHDYTPAWPGVMTYLNELSARLPLARIQGTSLVFLDGRRSETVRSAPPARQESRP